jgi:hypothetical protein
MNTSDNVEHIEPKMTVSYDLKLCPVCGEEIKLAAKKCIHCDSQLDWRRYLGLSSTTLALVTALLAVAGSTAPTIKMLFTAKNSSLRVSALGVVSEMRLTSLGYVRDSSHSETPRDDVLYLMVSNVGVREGSVFGGFVTARWKRKNSSDVIPFVLIPTDSKPKFIPAAQTRPVSMKLVPDLLAIENLNSDE